LLPPQLTEDSSSSQGNVARLEDESQRAVASIQQSIATKKNEVLDLLMHHVTTVKLTK
jgi:V-type H+-transporting ATPase subunit G